MEAQVMLIFMALADAQLSDTYMAQVEVHTCDSHMALEGNTGYGLSTQNPAIVGPWT